MTPRLLAAGALPLALMACADATPLPDTAQITASAAPIVPARQTAYADPIRYTARPVTDPGDWRESNTSQEGR